MSMKQGSITFSGFLLIAAIAAIGDAEIAYASPPHHHSPAGSAHPLDEDQIRLRASLEHFQKGAYSQALAALKTIKGSRSQDLPVLYWSGVCQYKLQNFPEAAKLLQKAVRKDRQNQIQGSESLARVQYKDAYYLLGQSYYAIQDFKTAAKAFTKSVNAGYKIGVSLYYIGYVNTLLEENDVALATFQKVAALPAPDDEMKQAAGFQIGEILFDRAQKEPNKEKQKQILLNQAKPAYEKAIAADDASALSLQAKGRIAAINAKTAVEVATEAGVAVPRTANGSAKPAKSWILRVGQEFKYDSNIINEPDNRIIKIENTGAPLSKTSVFGKYELLLFNRWALTPELSADATFHGRRTEGYVFSNDNTSLAPAIRSRLDHTLWRKSAAGLLEYEYTVTTRDYSAVKEQKYFSRTNNIVAGERAELTAFGSSMIKANLKFVENTNMRLNYWAPGINLNQNWKTIYGYLLNTGFTFENQRSNDPFYDQRNYKFNFSYGMPALVWQTNVDVAFSATLADIVNQRQTRGFEKNLSPSLTLTRTMDRASHWNVNLNYSFTRNISSDKTSYAYAKHSIGVGSTFTF